MQLSNIPGKLVLPFATGGGKNTIPVASQIGITAGAASLTDGFPPLTRTPIAAGGVPPSGLDMNGILYEMSAIIRWANAGGGYPYDGTFATDTNVGGYPKGARIMRSDGTGYWFNTVENNVTDPEGVGAAAAGWVPDYQSGATSVAMSGSSVTLTPNQYGKPLIVITGTLSANLNLIFPALAQGWIVINNATGGYSVTAKTASGSGVMLGTISQIVGDGTNIYAPTQTFIQFGTGAALRSAQNKMREVVSVTDFYANGVSGALVDPTGVVDSTLGIQAAINTHRGKIFVPAGTYKISSTIILTNETILIGEGAGGYFQGTGYPRLTVLQPTAGFTGNDILRADPADDGATAVYRYGVALRDLLIDCINIKNADKNIVKLYSVSNTETFDSVRIINNNTNIALRIGISANAPALESDGLSFNNIYCLQCDVGGSSTNPVLLIESGNEISFRDSKFQRGSSETTVSSKAAHINASAGLAVNAVTFDSCAFTGGEAGILVQGKNTDGQGPRWIRVQNCTFEGPKFPISVVGESTRPVQFCTFGPGNRMISLTAGGAGIVLSANANNNTVYADEFTTVLFDTFSSGNTLYGGNSLTDNGTSNIRINRNNNAAQLSNLYRESTIAPTLATGWSNASPTNRTSAGYWKDAQGSVHLQGYVGYSSGGSSLIFTLPAEYAPTRAQILTVTTNTGVGSVLINQKGSGSDGQITQLTGGTGWVSLDGLSFALN